MLRFSSRPPRLHLQEEDEMEAILGNLDKLNNFKTLEIGA